MGNLEKRHTDQIKRERLKEAILGSIKVAGFLSVALLAPNALQFLGNRGSSVSKKEKASINSVRYKLVKNGLLEYKDNKLYLTEKGKNVLESIKRKNFKLLKPKKWDKRWRIIVFDIKENRSNIRTKLRRTLVQIGFKKLQNSVWVYPYDCEDLITMLKADFKIGKDVLYIIAEHIEYDKPLRDFFNIP